MGTTTSHGGRRISAALAAAAVAGLAAACGGASTPAPRPSPTPTTTASASATYGLEQFRAVATGPLYVKVQQDLIAFTQAASRSDPVAAEAGARRVAADLTAWADALRAVNLPPAYQRAKSHILEGMALMSKGVTEVADGIHNSDTALINKGNADVQAGVKLIRQAQSEVP